MKIVIPVVTGFCALCLGFFIHERIAASKDSSANIVRLQLAEKAVTKSISVLSGDIKTKLDAFSRAVADDRLFALRLLAEQDRSSPDVTGFAERFLRPMGFSTLDIIDSAFSIVSSGVFTANTGTDVSSKIAGTGDAPVLIRDNVKGESKITYQAKKSFKIADIPFYVTGGCMVDQALLNRLSPFDGCTVFIRSGNEIIGSDTIRSVSEIKKHKMIVNDKEYYAASVPIASDNTIVKPELVIIIGK